MTLYIPPLYPPMELNMEWENFLVLSKCIKNDPELVVG
jgi:hypothetical protein